MYVIRGIDPTAVTETNVTATTQLQLLDAQTARIDPPGDTVLSSFNGSGTSTPTTVTSLFWSTVERNVFLNPSHLTIDHNELHLDDNVGTRFAFPTYRDVRTNAASYSATNNEVTFDSLADRIGFFVDIPGTTPTLPNGLQVLDPTNETAIQLRDVIIVVGNTRSQVRTTTPTYRYLSASGQRGFQILDSAGDVIDDPFGGNDISTSTISSTDGDTIEISNYNVISNTSLDTFIFPADRCRWRVDADAAGGYEIHDAQFYPGNGAPVSITNAELGYIGKSGRFVQIAN